MGYHTHTKECEEPSYRNVKPTCDDEAATQIGGVSRRQYIGAVSAAVGLAVGPSPASASHEGIDLEPNRAAITAPQPIVEENLTIAHYMTGMVPARTAEYFYTDPAYYDPNGPTSQLGGVMQHAVPLALNNQSPDLYEHQPVDLSQKEAIRYEIETAMTFGVDGFDFYYPWTGSPQHQQRYNQDYLPNFFEVVAEEGYDFNLTIAVSHPYQGGTEQIISGVGSNIAALISRVGEDHPAWLTASDGRKVFYTWLADGIVRGFPEGHTLPDNPGWMKEIAEAYEAILQQAGTDALWMYDLHYAASYPDHTAYVDAALDYWPAIKGWITRCGQDEIWEYVAEQCTQRGRTFSQDVFSDFHTGIAYRGEPANGGIYVPGEAETVQPEQVKKWYKVLDVSKNFRDDLENVLSRDADMIGLTTWNDYAEGHHLAPEINHNFGFAQLFQHYVGQWRGESSMELNDVAIAFFKKYPSTVAPDPYDIGARVDTPCGDPSVEDVIEVVTILDAAADVEVNEQSTQRVGAGVQTTRFAMEPGQVDVTVTRNGETVTSFTTPEAITETPFRTDRLTFAFSSNHEAVWTDVFGDDPIMVSNQFSDSTYVDGPNFGLPGEGGDGGDDGGSGTAAPTNLRTLTQTDTTIDITWNHPNDGAVSYYVYVDGSRRFQWGSMDVVATIRNLEPDTNYDIYATANGADGESEPSNTITVSTTGAGGGTTTDAEVVGASSTPTIDGSVDSVWNDANEYSIDNVGVGSRSGTDDVSGSWRALWDETSLYVLIAVTDDSSTSDSTDWWADDAVELYLDGDNSKGTSYDGVNDFQLGFRYGESTVSTGGNSVNDTTEIQHAWSSTSSGYRLEISIPWNTIGVSASAGHVFGFDVAIDDDDDGASRDTQLLWHDESGTAWSNPSVFGTAELL